MESTKTSSEKISSMVQLVKQYELVSQELAATIDAEISTIPAMEGIKQISGSPICYAVPLSVVMANNGIFASDYYIPETQISAIRQRLAPCGKDMRVLVERIKEMIKDKCVYFRCGEAKYKTILNPNSISALQLIYDGLAELDVTEQEE